MPPESGSHALWLLTGAAALYVLSQLFAAWQLIIQEQQGGPRRTPPDPYGAGQELYVLLGLLPTYVAACLASIVLIGAPMLDGWVIGKFALVGALVWGLPFLVASRLRFDWLLAARFFSSAGFGVVLALTFALLRSLPDDRYVVVLGIAACFFSHLVGGILFAGLSSRISDHDPVREWTARAGGWFVASGLVWTVYAIPIRIGQVSPPVGRGSSSTR